MSDGRKQYRSIPLRTQRKQEHDLTRYDIPILASDRHTTPQKLVSRQAMPIHPDDERPARLHTSALRYVNTEGHEVLEQGNKRLVIHRENPRRGLHWAFYTGSGMLAALLLFVGAQWAITGIQEHTIDAQYGYPRTWQTDAVVGHNDSALHPSHFIFENLKDHIIVIELPGDDIAKAIIYGGPTLYSANADQIPVTGSFKDVNGDGRPDMEVDVGGQTIIFLNNGTKFVEQSQ